MNLKSKQGIMVLCGLIVSGTASASSLANNCGWLSNTTNKAITAVGSIAKQTMAIPQQSGSAIKRCISQIDHLGGGFDWELPTNLFSSLLNQACTISTSAVNNEMNQYVDQNVSYPGLVSANVGTGQSGVGYSVNNDSSSMASSLWQKALGNRMP